jgi:amino acid permease
MSKKKQEKLSESEEGEFSYAEDDRAPLVSRPDSSQSQQQQLLSKPSRFRFTGLVGVCYTINLILGVGVLGLPYAFSKAGTLLGLAILFLVSGFSVISAAWIPEICARANTAIDEAERVKKEQSAPSQTPSAQAPAPPPAPGPILLRNDGHAIQLNEAAGLFVGPKYRKFYEFLIIVSTFGTLTAYLSVASSTLSAFVPVKGFLSCNIYDPKLQWGWQCERTFLLWLGIFSALMVLISLLDFEDQVPLQVVLTGLRIVTVKAMVIIALVSLYRGTHGGKHGLHGALGTKISDWHGFGNMVATSAFAQAAHHSLPGVLAPLLRPRGASYVITAGYLVVTLLYIALGLSVCIYFGPTTLPLATLNFLVIPGFESDSQSPAWARALSTMIVVFPIMDIMSIFGLVAVTQANTILTSIRRTGKTSPPGRGAKVISRIFTVAVPVLLVYFFRQINTLFDFLGPVNVIVSFINPAILLLASRKWFSHSRWGPASKTPYDTMTSSKRWAYLALLFGFVTFVITNADQLIQSGIWTLSVKKA